MSKKEKPISISYETKKILFFLCLLTFSTQAFAQDYKFINEIRVGPLNFHVGSYKTLNEKSVVGATAIAGFVFPALYTAITPEYKYYFNGYSKEKASYHGSFVATMGVNFMFFSHFSAKPQNEAKSAVLQTIITAGLGLGYEFKLKRNFFFRPSLNLRFPILSDSPKAPYLKQMVWASGASTAGATLAAGYRF